MAFSTYPCNPDAQEGARNVYRYLAALSGRGIVTGQHTKTMGLEELYHIERVTGQRPALLGFELLSYSPNINYMDTDQECMDEVMGNYGTLRRAWEWAEQKGLITFTWHWFSPLSGHGKSFFAQNTGFDARKALQEGTAEHRAFVSDLDCMAGILRPFRDRGVPILWRPFHEAEGNWFWWGAGVIGSENAKALYRFMYQRFTAVHHLDNLLWVWNSPRSEDYPGDDTVDFISRDMYPAPHTHTAQEEKLAELQRIADKPALIGETGTVPSADALEKAKAQWASYMTWCGDFCLTENFTSNEELNRMYRHPWAVTKEKLPILY